MNASTLAPDERQGGQRAGAIVGSGGAPRAGIVGCAAVRPLVVLPTYNEAHNIADVLARSAPRCRTRRSSSSTTAARTAPPTSRRRSGASSATSRCCGAPGKAGLGSAYRAGFREGLAARPRRADRDGLRSLSTIRRRCPSLLAAIDDGADLVIGSRVRARWDDPGLGVAPPAPVALGQPLRGLRARPAGARRDRRVPRLPRELRSRRSTSTRSRPTATGSRSRWPTP